MVKSKLIYLIILFPALILGQEINLSFEQIDSKTGLGAAYNEFIYKDSRGFVWISSIGGLYRYDGLEMKVYQPTKDSTSMIGSNIQSHCFEDSQGNIWFSTAQAMNCYVRSQDTVFSRQFIDSLGNPINQHYSIFYLENDSIIWTKAGEGIYTYNIHTRAEKKIVEGVKVMRFAVDTTETGSVKDIYACRWDYGSGFYHITIDNGAFQDSVFLLKDGLPGSSKVSIEVSGALVQNRDSVWLFTAQGLVLYQSKERSQSKFQLMAFPVPYKETSIRGGAMIKNKYLVIGIKNAGLWFFDIKKWKLFKPKMKSNPQFNDILDLREIYVDQQDHLWISPWDGAQVQHSWLYNNSFSNPFEHLNRRPPVVNSIAEDKEQNIWCATANDGIYIFDQTGKFINQISYRESDFKSIKQLSLSPDGEIWAINDKFIFKCKNRVNNFEKIGYLNNLTLFRLIHITSNLRLLTTSRGVYELTNEFPANKPILKASETIGDKYFPSFQIFQGDKGYVYLPDNEGDLRIYRWNNHFFEVIDTLELNTEVYDVVEDLYDKNILWVGSLKGLLKIDVESSAEKLMLEEEEFLSEAKILSITSDNKRRLWLSTNMGLLCYNPMDGSVFRYQKEDGLASQDFSLFANIKSRNGELWFGTNNGLVRFSPDSIQSNPFIPQIYIRNLLINQNEVGNALGKHIGELGKLNLKSGENSFDFDIIALSSYLPALNKLYYKLENHEEEWSGLENGEHIRFINLKSGEYNLQIKTENANGLSEHSNIETIGIEIAPSIYEQSWFWVLLIAFLLGSTWIGLRIYYKRKMKRQEELAEHKRELERKEFERKQALQEALEKERNRIAAEMHDDLGGGLTSIKLLIKRTFKESMSEKAVENLAKIEQHATGSIESMSEIIWAMNSTYDNLDDLIAFIRRYVAETLDENNIDYKAMVPQDLPAMTISGEKRRNIFLAIKEVIHNVIKHAEADLVTLLIELEEENQILSIVIKDNGIGLRNGENRFGNGLKNIKSRMKEINATISFHDDSGTSITMKIPIKEKTPIAV